MTDERPRTWIGEALAAYDQALTTAGNRDVNPGPDFWVSRAQAAAGIAAAQQARIANLIAWKQLRQTAPASSLPLAGDAVSDEIEQALGIATAEPVSVVEQIRAELLALRDRNIAAGDAPERGVPQDVALTIERVAALVGIGAP